MWRWLCIAGCCKRKRSRSAFESTGTSNTSAQENRPVSRFLTLPIDLKQSITSYLPVQDALRLRQVSKRVLSDLSLSVRPAFQILQAGYWECDLETGNTPRMATMIPVFDKKRTHSITIQCQWREQVDLRGNGRSKLFIVAHRPDDDDFCISTGTVVAKADFGRTFPPTKMAMSFRPEYGAIYYLWYMVGGAPGHQLYISNIQIYALVFEDID